MVGVGVHGGRSRPATLAGGPSRLGSVPRRRLSSPPIACCPGTSPVGKGDAFAWDEAEIVFPERFLPPMSQLMEARNPVEELPSQLVHGDQGGNILFHPELPPAVIDVSPYWRPKRYADTIVVADAVAWADAGLRALEPLRDPVGLEMMLRAVLFRLGAAAITFHGHDELFGVEIAAYQPIVRSVGVW
jgi:hypothetical protein